MGDRRKDSSGEGEAGKKFLSETLGESYQCAHGMRSLVAKPRYFTSYMLRSLPHLSHFSFGQMVLEGAWLFVREC